VKYGGYQRGVLHRRIRELAVRSPAAMHTGLARIGALRRTRVLRWDLSTTDWQFEERFI